MKTSSILQIFFLILAGLLVWFSFFKHKQKEQTEKIEKINALIFKDEIKKENISFFNIQKQDGSSFTLEKKKNLWELIHPVEDKADYNKVDTLFKNLLDQSAVQIAEGDVHWSEYQLNPPFSMITIKAGEKEWKIGVSETSNFDDRYYIKKGDNLLLGSSEWKTLSRVWPDDYRSKKLYLFNKRPVRLSFKTKNKNYKFNYHDYSWKWEGKNLFPLSHSAFEQFWTSLREEKIKYFTGENKSKAFKKLLWKNPDLELKLVISESQIEWTLWLKKSKDEKYYLILSDRNYVFETDEVSAKKLLEVDFRDHKAPFKFDLKALSQVDIDVLDLDFSMKKQVSDQEKWKIIKPENHHVDMEKFGSFLDWMDGLEAQEYSSKPLLKKTGQIVMKNQEGEILLSMNFGSVYKEWIQVQTSNSKKTLTINYQDFKQALPSSLIEKKEKEPEKL